MGNDNEISIESLRADVENEYRFKSVYRGYDKKSVNAYISSLKSDTIGTIEKLKEDVRIAEAESEDSKSRYLTCKEDMESNTIRYKKRMEQLKSECEDKIQEIEKQKSAQIQQMEAEMNAKMADIISQKDKEIQNLNNKLVNREEAEKKLQESAIEGYKVTNARLSEENNKKTIRISELEEKLALATSNMDNNIEMFDSLNTRLNEMLRVKFSECEDILSIWSDKFNETSGMIRKQIEDK